MSKKVVLTLTILVVLIAIGGYVAYAKYSKIVPRDITWTFEDKGTDSITQAPSTHVVLTVKGNHYDGGTYTGTCSQKTDGLDQNELSAILCYFAGSGDEVGIFSEGKALVLKHGEIQEPSEEMPAFRGNFKTLLSL